MVERAARAGSKRARFAIVGLVAFAGVSGAEHGAELGGKHGVELVARTAPWRADERMANAAREAGQLFPLVEGAQLGELIVDEEWRDFRGQAIAPGRYALRYALQPRLKEHAGVDQVRDFALLVPPETAIEPGSRTAEEWIAASRLVSRTKHPAVMALGAWTGRGEPPEEPVPAGERRIAFRRIGELSVGFVVCGQVEATEPF